MDFKSVPNERKEVEIGYGLEKQYEHKGYMTEAVKAFCEWALTNVKIETIITETEKESVGSIKILERVGFTRYKEEETIWWKLKKEEIKQNTNVLYLKTS